MFFFGMGMDSLEKLAQFAQEYWFIPVALVVLPVFGYALGSFAERICKDYEKIEKEMQEDYYSPDINDD